MHPLDKFKFCPVCGSNRFGINNFKSKKCADCGFTYYMNPSAATVALILNKQGELLAVRRKNEPARGTLDMPGGFSDAKETSEQGVIREVMEETGLTVRETQYLFTLPNDYEYSGLPIPTMDVFFICRVDDFSPLHANDDAAECVFIKKEDLNPDDFGLLSIRRAMKMIKDNPKILWRE